MAREDYEDMKKRYTEEAIDRLAGFFPNLRKYILHVEAATPRTFHQFTARPLGGVGGLGQRPAQFGPFSFSNRTPYPNLWLVGDSTYPGEGTAGVSYSALNALTLMEKSF
jgi:phytoene dehydrogenase-like protein